MSHGRPLILGHRGAPREAPENTLRAFRLALEQGADGVELDVQPSADGVPVILHDDTLDRTTDARGDVARLTWAEIRRARSGGEPVPRLEEVIAWAAESGAYLNLELKRFGCEQSALRLVRAAGLLERTIFSSFLTESVAAVRRLDPQATCYLLSDGPGREVLRLAAELRVHGVCLGSRRATPALLAALCARGLPVVVWTVDRPPRVKTLLAAGVQGLITNFPARTVALARD